MTGQYIIEDLIDCFNECFSDDVYVKKYDVKHVVEEIRDRLQNMIENDQIKIQYVFGEPAGFIYQISEPKYIDLLSMDFDRLECQKRHFINGWIPWVGVRKAFRRKGLATNMILDFAKKKRSVIIDVSSEWTMNILRKYTQYKLLHNLDEYDLYEVSLI